MGGYKEDFVMHLRVKTYLKCLQGFQSKHLAVGVLWSGRLLSLTPAGALLLPRSIVSGSLEPRPGLPAACVRLCGGHVPLLASV